MPVPPRRQTAPALTRRAALATLVVGLAGTAACDDHRSGAGRGPGVSGSAGTAGRAADAVLVDRVRTELSDLLAMVTAAGTRFGSLEHPLRPFGELHRAHLAALRPDGTGGAGGAGQTPSPTAAQGAKHSPAATLQAVLRRERQVRGRLVDAAVAADSGSLARLFASMSAGMAQLLVATGGTPGTGAS